MIAFFGLTAIGGRFGDLIADIPFTVIAVLIASLVECFLILPNHMSHALTPFGKEQHWYDWPSRQVNKGFRFVRERLFRPLIAAGDPGPLPGARRGDPGASGPARRRCFSTGDVTFRFFNAPEQSERDRQLRHGARAPPATTRVDDAGDARSRRWPPTARELEAEHGANPVTYVLGQVGGNAGRGLASAEDKDADLLGAVTIELIDADLRPYSLVHLRQRIAGPGAAPPDAGGAELPRRPVRPRRRRARRAI